MQPRGSRDKGKVLVSACILASVPDKLGPAELCRLRGRLLKPLLSCLSTVPRSSSAGCMHNTLLCSPCTSISPACACTGTAAAAAGLHHPGKRPAARPTGSAPMARQASVAAAAATAGRQPQTASQIPGALRIGMRMLGSTRPWGSWRKGTLLLETAWARLPSKVPSMSETSADTCTAENPKLQSCLNP